MRKIFFLLLLIPVFGFSQSPDGTFKTLTATMPTTDNYVISEPLPAVYDSKEKFIVVFPFANATTSPTLNRNSLGAKAILKEDGSAPAIGTICACRKLLSYNGTYFQILGGAGSGTVTSVASADGSISITNPSTNVDLSVIKSPKWTTARSISITGDIAYTTSIDGTGNVTGTGTLATVNSNVGTFGNATQSLTATVNGKGLITAMSAQTVTPAVGSITGLGTGVATWLATPSWTNFNSAITGTAPYWSAATGVTTTGINQIISNSPNQIFFTGTWTASTINDLNGNFGGSFTAATNIGVSAYRFTPTLTPAGTSSVQTAFEVRPVFVVAGTTPINNTAVFRVTSGQVTIGTGQINNEILLVSQTQNSLTKTIFANSTSNTLAGVQLLLSASTISTPTGTLTSYSPGFTTSNMRVAGALVLEGLNTAGTNVGTSVAGPTNLYTNNVLRLGISSGGVASFNGKVNLTQTTTTSPVNLGGFTADSSVPVEGDLGYNLTSHLFKYFNGTSWISPVGGTGTVTSVTITAGSNITQSGSPITTSGAITINAVPSGSNGQIQINNSGVFGGDPNFTFVPNLFTLSGTNPSFQLNSSNPNSVSLIKASKFLAMQSQNGYDVDMETDITNLSLYGSLSSTNGVHLIVNAGNVMNIVAVGTGNTTIIYNATSTNANDNGTSLKFIAGDGGGAGGTGNGGNLTLSAGSGGGGGVDGNIILSHLTRFNSTNITGAGSALLGANSPASTLTAPYTWFKVITSDGSTGYIPVWK